MSNNALPTRGRTRREVLTALGVGVAGGVLAGRTTATGTAAAGTVDWPQASADAANSGYLPDGRGPASGYQQNWFYDNDRYHDGLAVADGTVYVGGKSLAAIDADTGREQWAFSPDEGTAEEPDDEGDTPEFGTPAVADGLVFAAVGFGVYDGTIPGDDDLVAVDSASGTERWRFDPDDSARITDPTVADGTVYVRHQFRDGSREAGTALYALAADGTVKWQRSLAWRGSRTPVCVAEGLVFAPGEDGVTAFDATTGEPVWNALPEVSFARGPQSVVSDGILFVTETVEPGATIVALDATTGEERWRKGFGSEDSPRFTVGATDDQRVYVQWERADADVIALDAATGSEQWRTAVTAAGERNHVWTDGLARAGDVLYAGESALDPTNGSVIWKRATNEASAFGWQLAAVSEGRSYLIGEQVKTLIEPDNSETPTGTASRGTEARSRTATRTAEPRRISTTPPDRSDMGDRTSTPTPQSGSAGTEAPTGRSGARPANTSSATPTTTDAVSTVIKETTSGSGPGLGVITGLAGLGAAVATLARRHMR